MSGESNEQEGPMPKWTKEKPTKEGLYKIKYTNGREAQFCIAIMDDGSIFA